MIIIGYPGVGKSTLSGKNKYIDLESSIFDRVDNWENLYCKVAIYLSKQGYNVFVSSHKNILDILSTEFKESIVVVFPSLELEEKWIDKLFNRFTESGSPKDYNAYKRAKDFYKLDIQNLLSSIFEKIEIEDIDYCLDDMLYNINRS